MMNSCLILLVVGMATAMNVPQDNVKNTKLDEKVHFDVNVAGERTEENIEMNYEENYVRVTNPGLRRFRSIVLIHDYTKDLTLYKVNGKCYMINEYPDIPARMEDWYDLQLNMEDGIVQAGTEARYRAHKYNIIPFALNRTMVPAVMRKECSKIEMMVVKETVSGQQAYEVVQNNLNNTCLGAVYLPVITDRSQDLKKFKGIAKRSVRLARGGCWVCVGWC